MAYLTVVLRILCGKDLWKGGLIYCVFIDVFQILYVVPGSGSSSGEARRRNGEIVGHEVDFSEVVLRTVRVEH